MTNDSCFFSGVAEYFKSADSLGLIAILVGLLGVFGGKILKLFFKPKLRISAKLAPPDCHKTQLKSSNGTARDCFYFRFRIENFGNEDATELEVMITSVEKKSALGKFELFKAFLPQNLRWSHIHGITMKRVPPKVFKNLDFGYLRLRGDDLDALLTEEQRAARASTLFLVDTQVIPFNGAGVWFSGDYRVHLAISCKETGTFTKVCAFKFDNLWYTDEQSAFNELQFEIEGQDYEGTLAYRKSMRIY